jgi:hypothetical protein
MPSGNPAKHLFWAQNCDQPSWHIVYTGTIKIINPFSMARNSGLWPSMQMIQPLTALFIAGSVAYHLIYTKNIGKTPSSIYRLFGPVRPVSVKGSFQVAFHI